MQDAKLKRKRTPNFSAEEKMRFVRVLQEKGQLILSKVTSHDNASNKGKEQAWDEITRIHNSGGDIIRTTETLKKLWGKMKSEAKTYKAANKQSVSGTGGGPSKTFDDPVLELVVEMTGRASTGIVNINDCDTNEPLIENVNCSPSRDEEFLNVDMKDYGEEQIIIEAVIETDAAASTADVSVPKLSKDRRRPVINVSTERSDKTKQQARVSNRFAAERLRAEQEKINLIVQQVKQNEELHKIQMQNEKIKQDILEALLQKIQDAANQDIARVASEMFNK